MSAPEKCKAAGCEREPLEEAKGCANHVCEWGMCGELATTDKGFCVPHQERDDERRHDNAMEGMASGRYPL